MIVISHLALNEMIKLKGEIVDICLLLESEDSKLVDLVKLFLHELRQKGNNIVYNLIPKALARLSNDFKDIGYDRFQKVIKELIANIDKEKQVEGLIEKLVNKLKNNNDQIEWRNITFCLSLLSYSQKNLMKLKENYETIKDKVDDDIVKQNLIVILEKVKKGANKEELKEIYAKFMKSLNLSAKDLERMNSDDENEKTDKIDKNEDIEEISKENEDEIKNEKSSKKGTEDFLKKRSLATNEKLSNSKLSTNKKKKFDEDDDEDEDEDDRPKKKKSNPSKESKLSQQYNKMIGSKGKNKKVSLNEDSYED